MIGYYVSKITSTVFGSYTLKLEEKYINHNVIGHDVNLYYNGELFNHYYSDNLVDFDQAYLVYYDVLEYLIKKVDEILVEQNQPYNFMKNSRLLNNRKYIQFDEKIGI